MNALFGTVIKVFLTLVQTHDAVSQDDGDGADGGDGIWVSHWCQQKRLMSSFLLPGQDFFSRLWVSCSIA
jgi:hypothetical protein